MSAEHAAKARAINGIIVAVLAAALLTLPFVPVWWRNTTHPLHWRGEIAEAAGRHRMDPYLVAAVINRESGFDPATVSEAGAVGLMQVLPSTAKALGSSQRTAVPTNVNALSDPSVNIELGTLYLRQLLTRFDDPRLALAAYNAGATRVDGWIVASEEGTDLMERIRYASTRRYVKDVLEEQRHYRRLYPRAFEGLGE